MDFVIQKDRKGEWRWRLVAANGRILADSGEGYKRRATMIRTIRRIQAMAVSANMINEKGQVIIA